MTKYYGDGDSNRRKQVPVASGLFDYFPNALAAIAEHSYFSHEKHNPGQPLHWSRSKSADHADAAARHLRERGGFDTEGRRHSAGLAWRALAVLEEELIAEGFTPGRGTTTKDRTAKDLQLGRGVTLVAGGKDADPVYDVRVLDTPVDRILNGRDEAGFKTFAEFEARAERKSPPSDAEVEKAMLGFLQHLLGPDVTVFSDAREFYKHTGEWPRGVEKTAADEAWLADYQFFGGGDWGWRGDGEGAVEVTAKGRAALAAGRQQGKTNLTMNRIKSPVKVGAKAATAKKSVRRAPARKRR